MIIFRLGLFFLLVFSSACQTGKRAQPIGLPTEALDISVKNAGQEQLTIVENAGMPNHWWTLFQDEQLNQLIETTYDNNPTLQIALAHIQLAKTIAGKARAALYPTIIYGADVSRQKLSETGIIPFDKNTSGIAAAAEGNETGGAQPSYYGLPPGAGTSTPAPGGKDRIPVYFTQYETELTLTYEFDVWGKNRNLLKAAIGEIRAKVADQAFIKLELGISVAQLYYRLQTNYKRKEIAHAIIKNKEKFLSLVRDRIHQNLDNVISLQNEENELLSAKQQLLQIENTIAIDEYQLKAYLAGNFMEEIEPIRLEMRSLPHIPIPNDLPFNLIANRPDITAQLWLIESAGKQIEVAKAGFYPNFNIFALFGFQTITLEKLLYWKSSYFNIDPAVTLPVFDGGRLLSNLQMSEVNYDAAIYKYNQLILNATKEVLTALSVLTNTENQLLDFKQQLSHQEKILELTKLRIANHIDSGLDYLYVENNFLKADDAVQNALGETVQSILLLIKALGGGYNECDPEN